MVYTVHLKLLEYPIKYEWIDTFKWSCYHYVFLHCEEMVKQLTKKDFSSHFRRECMMPLTIIIMIINNNWQTYRRCPSVWNFRIDELIFTFEFSHYETRNVWFPIKNEPKNCLNWTFNTFRNFNGSPIDNFINYGNYHLKMIKPLATIQGQHWSALF